MAAIDLWSDLSERQTLQTLEKLIRQPAAMIAIESIAARVERQLERDTCAALAWEPVPLEAYAATLPPGIGSSWVFILRAATATGAERHPNSHQRVVSFRGSGDLQVMVDRAWQSNPLVSELSAPLERRWLSIPPFVWHQAVVPESNWVVVSFHTVLSHELIEERPGPGNEAATRQRTYIKTVP
jgi:hypothetical protein